MGRRVNSAPEPLGPRHDAEGFDCGVPALNGWLRRRAPAGRGRRADIFVACEGTRVVGFYALSAGTVLNARGSLLFSRNAPLPVLKLGRLAVDRPEQGRGVGTALVMDTCLRAYAVSRQAVIAALLVDAPDAAAAGWFGRLGFRPALGDATAMFLALGTIEALVERRGRG